MKAFHRGKKCVWKLQLEDFLDYLDQSQQLKKGIQSAVTIKRMNQKILLIIKFIAKFDRESEKLKISFPGKFSSSAQYEIK